MNAFELRFREAGNDYDAAKERTAGDEELLRQLMLMFKADGGFAELSSALASDDCKAAFAAAHAIKGSSGMLGMVKLFSLMSDMTELLRAGNIGDAKLVFPRAELEYDRLIEIIGELA